MESTVFFDIHPMLDSSIGQSAYNLSWETYSTRWLLHSLPGPFSIVGSHTKKRVLASFFQTNILPMLPGHGWESHSLHHLFSFLLLQQSPHRQENQPRWTSNVTNKKKRKTPVIIRTHVAIASERGT